MTVRHFTPAVLRRSLLLLLLLLPLTVAAARPDEPSTLTTVRVTDQIARADVRRFGINLGARDQYGASQTLKNLIPNPGFESAAFAMIFHAATGATANRVQADNWDTSWNSDAALVGHPPYFWNGGTFEVIDGAAFGRSGTITNFTHDDNKYTYTLNGNGVTPAAQDVFVVRKTIPGFNGNSNPLAVAETADVRPGSPGSQSLRLLPPSQSWQASYLLGLDSYGRDGDRSAGKLLLVEGNWRISLWAKTTAPGGALRILFQRAGDAIFFDETVALSTDWQLITRTFNAPPGADPVTDWDADNPSKALTFELRLQPGSPAVLVDDALLAQDGQTNPTVFHDRLVARLQALHPGVLRNWGGQLGASLDDQLALEWQRKPTGYSPRYRVGREYHWSLHEFLQLCELIGARPWYVVPPTFGDADMLNLAAYLAAPAGSHPYADRRAALGRTEPWTTAFDVIHLEFGNEIWGTNYANDPFVGATLRGGVRAARIADARFAALRSSPFVDLARFDLIIGGQVFFPQRQTELETNSTHHTTIGLAPYFGKLYTYDTPEERYYPLYAHSQWVTGSSPVTQSLANIQAVGQGTQAALYEINLFAVDGSAPLALRNGWLTGVGAGIALPLTLLHYQRDLGIRTALAYRESQFSYRMANGEYGRLWGLLRDLTFSNRARPTWLGLELLNHAVRGDLLVTQQTGANPTVAVPAINNLGAPQELPLIQSYAYRDGNSAALVLFNLDLNNAQAVQIDLLGSVAPTAERRVLTGPEPTAGNETAETISTAVAPIADFGDGYTLTLPPFSMTVLDYTYTDTPTNTVPIAVDDDYFVLAGGVLQANVIANDADADHQLLTIAEHTIPAHGAFTISADGDFTYTPDPGFLGVDTFTYRITDGVALSNTAVVTIHVIEPAGDERVYLPIAIR